MWMSVNTGDCRCAFNDLPPVEPSPQHVQALKELEAPSETAQQSTACLMSQMKVDVLGFVTVVPVTPPALYKLSELTPPGPWTSRLTVGICRRSHTYVDAFMHKCISTSQYIRAGVHT